MICPPIGAILQLFLCRLIVDSKRAGANILIWRNSRVFQKNGFTCNQGAVINSLQQGYRCFNQKLTDF